MVFMFRITTPRHVCYTCIGHYKVNLVYIDTLTMFYYKGFRQFYLKLTHNLIKENWLIVFFNISLIKKTIQTVFVYILFLNSYQDTIIIKQFRSLYVEYAMCGNIYFQSSMLNPTFFLSQ